MRDTICGSYQHLARNQQQPSWYVRATLVASLTAVLMSLAGMTSSANAFDVAVGEIHITQGVQHSDPNPLFWVPLVAERSTAVRVQVERVSGTPGSVTGKLRVWVDGQEITPPGGVDDLNQTFPAPHNQFVPPPTPNGGFFYLLEFEEHTLNFELPATVYPLVPSAGQNESHDVDFAVEIFAAGDTDPSNNIGQVDNLTVRRRGAPWLFKDRVFFFPTGVIQCPVPAANRPNDSFIAPEIGDAMAPALWPIPDAPTNTGTQTNPIFPPLLPGFYHRIDCNSDGKITSGVSCPNGGDEQGLLLGRLLLRRQLLIRGGFGPDRLVYLYAWVQDGQLAGHDGVARLGENVGYGIDALDRGQQVFAHDLGHMVGLEHNDPGRVVDEYGWDVGARLHNNPLPMVHGVTGRVKPAKDGFIFGIYHEVMNDASQITATTWSDLENYTALLNDPKLDVESATPPCDDTYETLLISGSPVRLDPLSGSVTMRGGMYRYPWCTPLSLEPRRANLIVRLQVVEPSGKSRLIELPIDASMVIDLPDGAGEEVEWGPFVAPVPVPKGTRVVSLRIEGLEDNIQPTALKPSAYVPQVTIVSPKPYATLGAKTTIAWAGSDADKGTTLTYQVAYSPNDGHDFIPLEVELTEKSITIDSTQLPPMKKGQGLIRVFVNDGMHTSFADVRGLSQAQ